MQLSKTSDPLLGGALGTVRFRVKEAILQVAGAYRVLDSESTPVDVLAGARYTHLDGDMSFSPSRFLPGGAGRNGSVGWTDGFVGARVAYALSKKQPSRPVAAPWVETHRGID
ncbi:hypothetical protein [Caballeronia sp. S22]|uniref:hypothetical protein n=1 Tax=Caballeronia sp. S22 TaxID=3137182 RepID=UPI0035307A69